MISSCRFDVFILIAKPLFTILLLSFFSFPMIFVDTLKENSYTFIVETMKMILCS